MRSLLEFSKMVCSQSPKDIYSHGKNLQKCKGYLTMMHRVPNTITQLDKALHARQRRLLSHGFSDGAMRMYDKVIAAHADNFCHYLAQDLSGSLQLEGDMGDNKWSSPKDMAKWCEFKDSAIPIPIVSQLTLLCHLPQVAMWLSTSCSTLSTMLRAKW